MESVTVVRYFLVNHSPLPPLAEKKMIKTFEFTVSVLAYHAMNPLLNISANCRVSSRLLLWIALFPLALHADENGTNRAILKSLTFYASFNRGVDADFAQGDPKLYTIVSAKPEFKTAVGLQAEGMTKLIKGKGLSGDALQFMRRDAKKLFYKAKKNLAYGRREWSGTVSLWLRLDPEKDLDPGYCDPIQITPRQWNDGAFFVDFDRAGDPRDFRLGVFADLDIWNAQNRDWNDIPEDERPLVTVHHPPFAGDKWTHVVFTWNQFNRGDKSGVAAFYLDGRLQGRLTGWEQTMTWGPNEECRIQIGLNYIGLFDDLSCFDRALTSQEVRRLYDLKGELSALVAK